MTMKLTLYENDYDCIYIYDYYIITSKSNQQKERADGIMSP